MPELFRIFRRDGEGFIYIGTFEGENVKQAMQEAVYADALPGSHEYEAHVLRNASFFEAKFRDERFVDILRPVKNPNSAD